MLFFGIKENLQHLYTDPSNLDRIIAQHQAVVAAIRRRDPEAASEAMRTHISFVIDFFREREGE